MIAARPTWTDRRAAGRALADALAADRLQRPPAGGDAVVVAVPRGGVVVAAEVARQLGLPLTTWSVRKLALPTDPEIALGALAPGGVILWDPGAERMFRGHEQLRDAVVAQQRDELERRRTLYGDAPPARLRGHELIVVDDGIATGLTVRAALTSLRKLEPSRLVLAVPVAAQQSLPALRALADQLLVLQAPHDLVAVSHSYARFAPVQDHEVLDCLRQAAIAIT